MALKPKSDDIKSVEVAGVGRAGVGGAGVGLPSTDRLSLDLQFAADKTLTARKGPTPVFTRASTATFVGSNGLIQSAAINTARFDHDPITLACKGLLIEESRTNLTARSEGLDATPWAVQNATTITSNNTASPDGNVTAELFTVGATSTVYGIQNSSVSWTSGTTYTVSCFFKAREITRVNITVNNTGVLPINATFDLTGSGSIVGTPTGTAIIQRYGNGWYRCSVSATALSTALTAFRFSAVSGTSTTYPGNSVDSFYGWGAQVEAGAFPTSYIPTTTASVVRSADICSITGANFTSIYNQSEGTLFVDARVETAARSANGFFAGIYNVSNNEFSTRIFSGSIQVVSRDPTSKDFSIGTATTNTKAATVYSNLNNAGSLNGSAVITGTVSTLPLMTSLGIGSRYSNTLFINGHIAALKFYKKRLANAKLASLTV